MEEKFLSMWGKLEKSPNFKISAPTGETDFWNTVLDTRTTSSLKKQQSYTLLISFGVAKHLLLPLDINPSHTRFASMCELPPPILAVLQ